MPRVLVRYRVAHHAERVKWPRMTGRDFVALAESEAPPSRFRQPSFVRSKNLGDDMIQGGDDRAVTAPEFYTCMRRETLGAADVAVTSHEDDRLLLHVDAQAACLQKVFS